MTKALHDVVWRADLFAARDIPPREWLADGCIPAPSIGMLYAYRGAGKTLTAMDMSLAVARGRPWLGYQVPRPRTVLYVDGEMPIADMKHRLLAQSGPEGVPDNLYILSSEDLAMDHKSLNLARAEDRDAITQLLVHFEQQGHKIELLILDNWVSLIRGLDENSNSEKIDELKSWLIFLRHGEISVLFVHHAGKGGGQRGASAREDIIDYSIKLSGRDGPEQFEWDKTRTGRPDPDAFGIRLEYYGDTEQYMRLRRGEKHKTDERGVEPKHDSRILEWLKQNGAAKFSEIAEALELDNKQVARDNDSHAET
jgi:RecA-family ATPase